MGATSSKKVGPKTFSHPQAHPHHQPGKYKVEEERLQTLFKEQLKSKAKVSPKSQKTFQSADNLTARNNGIDHHDRLTSASFNESTRHCGTINLDPEEDLFSDKTKSTNNSKASALKTTASNSIAATIAKLTPPTMSKHKSKQGNKVQPSKLVNNSNYFNTNLRDDTNVEIKTTPSNIDKVENDKIQNNANNNLNSDNNNNIPSEEISNQQTISTDSNKQLKPDVQKSASANPFPSVLPDKGSQRVKSDSHLLKQENDLFDIHSNSNSSYNTLKLHREAQQQLRNNEENDSVPKKRLRASVSHGGLQHISERDPDIGMSVEEQGLSFYSRKAGGLHKLNREHKKEYLGSMKLCKDAKKKFDKKYKNNQSPNGLENYSADSLEGHDESDCDLDSVPPAKSVIGRSISLRVMKKKLRTRDSNRSNVLRKSNSCSTLFVDQTVIQPDLDSILSSVSFALHMSFVNALNGRMPDPFDEIFDEKKHPLTRHRISSSYARTIPEISEIYEFLRAFFHAAVLKAEVAIVAMVYIARLATAGLHLQPANWKRVMLGSVLLASKVWDDQAVWNSDYCTVLPDVPVESMNELERKVLLLLYYNVSVSPSEYARHYFDLRRYALFDIKGNLPKTVLDNKQARKLDVLSQESIVNEHVELRRINSSDKLVNVERAFVIS